MSTSADINARRGRPFKAQDLRGHLPPTPVTQGQDVNRAGRLTYKTKLFPRVVLIEPNHRNVYIYAVESPSELRNVLKGNAINNEQIKPIVADIEGISRLVDFLVIEEDYDLAMSLLSLLVRVNPKAYSWVRQWALVHLGRLNVELGRPEDALQMFRTALSVPDCDGTHVACHTAIKNLTGTRSRTTENELEAR